MEHQKNPVLYKLIKIYSKEITEAIFLEIIWKEKKKTGNNLYIHILNSFYLSFSLLYFSISVKCIE